MRPLAATMSSSRGNKVRKRCSLRLETAVSITAVAAARRRMDIALLFLPRPPQAAQTEGDGDADGQTSIPACRRRYVAKHPNTHGKEPRPRAAGGGAACILVRQGTHEFSAID